MIILKNKGEIDIDFIKTMGVNVKETENPIGYFGTGLKYAIAVLLRESIYFCLYIGEMKFEFFTEPKTIRGKEFQLCKMKGPLDIVDLGIATNLGRDWELWMAYRELRSNCMDEGGEWFEGPAQKGEAGYTTICIDGIDPRGVFLADANLPLLFSNDDIEIYEGESDVIFYRGIRARDLEKPSMYTYNIKRKCDLTEDRRLCYDYQVQHAINESIASMDNKAVIKSVITAGNQYFESKLDMKANSYVAPKEPFLEVFNQNSKGANSRVREFVQAHAPKAPPTRAEKRASLLQALSDLCRTYGLNHTIEYHPSLVQITGDLLAEE